MKEYKREIEKDLKFWKEKQDRKPLILRGARQIGKSTIVRKFGQSFDYYIELNLEREKDANYFESQESVKNIFDSIALTHQVKRNEDKQILLFIDEIQESPKVIQLLRYFYEDLPHIHVIAAGSLLEFALGEVKQFPVGRIEYLYMHPFNFHEFLCAENNEQLIEEFNKVPVSNIAHNILMERFHQYCIIGGMPEVVKRFYVDGNLSRIPAVYNSIWSTYKSDVEKYAGNKTELQIIRHILKTSPVYMDQRITFQNFGSSNYRSREVGEAFRNLDAAGIIRLIYPTTSYTAPLMIDYKKSPRLQFLDTGIVNHIIGIQSELIALKDLSNAFRGALIPHIIMQELISLNKENDELPHFWVRDKAQSSAEIDLVYRHQSILIPIEIKSGSAGSMKSLHYFMNHIDHDFAVRIYGGSFSIEEHKTPEGKRFKLMNLPYYLGTKIPEFVNYFLEQENNKN
jgi:hypothetical protein